MRAAKVVSAIFVLLWIVSALPATAYCRTLVQSLSCIQDSRTKEGPKVGTVQEVILQRTSEAAYDVVLKTVYWDWTTQKEIQKTQNVAHELRCKFSESEPRIVACFRGKSENEKQDSVFMSTKTIVTGIDLFTGQQFTSEQISLELNSPDLAHSENRNFPIQECSVSEI